VAVIIVLHADGTEETSGVDGADDDHLGSSDQEVFSWVEPRLEPVPGD
jgi:hypothetical protein